MLSHCATLPIDDTSRLERREFDQWLASRITATNKLVLPILATDAEIPPDQSASLTSAAGADLDVVDGAQIRIWCVRMSRAELAAATLAPRFVVVLVRRLPHRAALSNADRRPQALAVKEADRASFDEVRIDQIRPTRDVLCCAPAHTPGARRHAGRESASAVRPTQSKMGRPRCIRLGCRSQLSLNQAKWLTDITQI